MTERSELDGFWRALVECHHDIDAVLRLIAEQVTSAIGDGAVVTTVTADGTALHPDVALHHDPEVEASMREVLASGDVAIGVGVAGAVAADRRAVVLNDFPVHSETATSRAYRPFARAHPMKAIMIVPMVAGGELVGTLGAVRTRSDEPYTPADLRLLEALAERAALALADATAGPQPVANADFEALYRFNLDGVLLTRPDGRILAANPAACDLLCLTERQIVAATRDQLLVADDPRVAQGLAERTATGRVRAEVPMRRGDGTRFTADVTSILYPSGEGEVRALVIFRDVTDAAAAREAAMARLVELEQAVHRDPLTGLFNRHGLTVAAERLLDRADRDRRVVQLAFLDLDDLKGINDEQGHAAGDAALVAVAEAIRSHIREGDVACRVGGDEFVVLLADVSPGDAGEVLRRIEAALADVGAPPGTTFSTGVAERTPDQDVTLAELVDSADRAMYQHKLLNRLRDDLDHDEP